MIRVLLVLSLLANAYLWYRLHTIEHAASFSTSSYNPIATQELESSHHTDTSRLSQRLSLPTKQNSLKEQILTLYEQQQWLSLGPLITEYLAKHPRDWQVLFIEGQYLIHTQTSAVGIAYLYQLLNQVDDPAISTNISDYIDDHVQNLIRALMFNQDWYALSLLLEPLIQVDPLHRGFIETLATSYAEQNLPNAMFNTLGAVTPEDVIYRRVVERWRQRYGDTTNNSNSSDALSSQNKQYASSIALMPYGNQWLTEIRLGGQTMTLLLDTGASTTAISQNAFATIPASNKQFLGRIVVNTANGQSQGELYRLNGARFGQWTFAEMDIVVLNQAELANDFDGLLGMNVLHRFAWQFDATNGKLLLTSRN